MNLLNTVIILCEKPWNSSRVRFELCYAWWPPDKVSVVGDKDVQPGEGSAGADPGCRAVPGWALPPLGHSFPWQPCCALCSAAMCSLSWPSAEAVLSLSTHIHLLQSVSVISDSAESDAKLFLGCC